MVAKVIFTMTLTFLVQVHPAWAGNDLVIFGSDEFKQGECMRSLEARDSVRSSMLSKQVKQTDLSLIHVPYVNDWSVTLRDAVLWLQSSSNSYADLYTSLFKIVDDPNLFKTWLRKHFYSKEISAESPAQTEDLNYGRGMEAQFGKSFERVARSIHIEVFSTHSSEDELIRQNGLIILHLSEVKNVSGVVLGMGYGGTHHSGFFIAIEGKNWASASVEVKKLRWNDSIGGDIKSMVVDKLAHSAFVVSKGRETHSYGQRAGTGSFLNDAILDWHNDWLSMNCMYEPSGRVVGIGPVYPYPQNLHYFASAWSRLIKERFQDRIQLEKPR